MRGGERSPSFLNLLDAKDLPIGLGVITPLLVQAEDRLKAVDLHPLMVSLGLYTQYLDG